MKKVITTSLLVAAAFSVGVLAAPVRDWQDLHKVHEKIQSAIRDMEQARAANHYDMAGHGEKAEKLLREAERELHEAVEASKSAR